MTITVSWRVLSIAAFLASGAAYAVNPLAGTAIGSILTFVITAKTPMLGLPLLFLGVMVRPAVHAGIPLQDGWFIIFAYTLGVGIHKLLSKSKLASLEPVMGALFAWSFVISVYAVLVWDANPMRHFAATALPLMAALAAPVIHRAGRRGELIAPSYPHLFALLASGLVLTAVLHALFSGMGFAHGIRGSFSLRIDEISPRSIAVVVGGLVTATLVALTDIRIRRALARPWLTYGLAAFAALGLLATGSKISILACITVVCLTLARQQLARLVTGRGVAAFRSVVVYGVLALLLAVGIAWISQTVQLRALIGFDFGAFADALGSRVARWSVYIENQGFLTTAIGTGIPNYKEWQPGHPHSFLVTSLLYYGVPGLALVLAAVSATAWRALRGKSWTALSLILYMLLVFTTSGFPDRPDFWALYLLTYAVIGVERYYQKSNGVVSTALSGSG